MKLKKGDEVLIITGKDRGKKSKIIRTFAKKKKIVIEKINIAKKHMKSREGMSGGIIQIERSIHSSNAMLICPKCNKPSRVAYEKTKNHKKQRICKKCNNALT